MMEKRKEKRKDEENKVVIELAKGKTGSRNNIYLNALSQDISLSGLRLQSDSSLPIDTNVNLKITLSKSKKTLKVNGRVKWVKNIQDNELYEMGIEFIEALPQKIIVLLQHLYGKTDKMH